MAHTSGGYMTVELYDKNLSFTHLVCDLASASMTVAQVTVGIANFTVDGDNPAVPFMSPLDGARAAISYYNKNHVVMERMTGRIQNLTSYGESTGETVVATVVDDVDLSRNWLAWPVPTNPLSNQDAEYDVRTGTVEAITAGYIDAVLGRVSVPLDIVPALTSGATTTAKARFDTVAELVQPFLAANYRTIRVQQWNLGTTLPPGMLAMFDHETYFAGRSTPIIVAVVGTPPTAPSLEFTPQLGVNRWVLSQSAPTATRVIVGGQGEGTLRVFTEVSDPLLETQVGLLASVEVFRDARDVDTLALRQQRGAEALAAGAPAAGVYAEITDGDPWVYGVDYYVGSIVPVRVGQFDILNEPIREVTISQKPEEGLTIVPKIGRETATSDPDLVLARRVAAIQTQVRRLETRK